jgi:glycosyltransferase involved in cell wall biosynthesis
MSKPDLAPLAMYLGRHAGSKYVFWLGDGADAFEPLGKEFVLLGADRSDRLASVRTRIGGTWLEHDFERAPLVLGDPHPMENAVVVCNDIFVRPRASDFVAQSLQRFLDAGCTLLVTAPAPGSGKPLALESSAFAESLLRAGLTPTFLGLTASDAVSFEKTAHLAIVEPEAKRPQLWRKPPDAFSVVALVMVFNEADVIENVLESLFAQGVSVYLMDNWSTDDTLERASRYLGRGVIGIERNPLRDTATFDLERALTRVEHLSQIIDADWFVHYDIDEVRRSPFRGVGLRDALYAIDRAGYNAVDFTILNFRPLDDTFRTGMPVESHFTHFEFGKTRDLLRQRKAWKNLGRNVQLLERAGHDVLFPGRRVYPYKFITKHYSVRSQQHGERKVHKERRDRFNRREHELRKWHVHYEDVSTVPNFLAKPDEIIRFEASFYERYLVERLTGIGSARTPEFVDMYLAYHGESV